MLTLLGNQGLDTIISHKFCMSKLLQMQIRFMFLPAIGCPNIIYFYNGPIRSRNMANCPNSWNILICNVSDTGMYNLHVGQHAGSIDSRTGGVGLAGKAQHSVPSAL